MGASHVSCCPIAPLEVRSIDYVPLSERHRKVWHLGPLWFMSSARIATLAVGLISVTEGASLLWSVLAIVLGVLVGTLLMAYRRDAGARHRGRIKFLPVYLAIACAAAAPVPYRRSPRRSRPR